MNANEPVAFWNKDFDLWEENAIQTYKADGWDIPLYTHSSKDLTDEEILEALWITGNEDPQWIEDRIKDARAILRKAQEK